MLSVGLFHKFENPKNKAAYGYILAGGMISYMLSLSIYIVADAIIKQNYWTSLLVFCVISPFVIGKVVKYNTLKIYTVVQIICFLISLAIIILKFY